MEHLPIVIFEIVLCVFLGFVVMVDKLCYNLVAKMSETFNEKMKSRIKELIENSYWRNLFERDIYGNELKLRVEVPIFRVDYEYIKLAELKDIFR